MIKVIANNIMSCAPVQLIRECCILCITVSAFHVTCAQKPITLTGSLWTKSKFMGMSIGVTLVGGLTLILPEHNEVPYKLTRRIVI